MGKHPEKARPAPSVRSQRGLLGLLMPQIGPFCRAYTIRGATHWRQKEGAKEQLIVQQEDLTTYHVQDTLTL